MVYTYIYGLTCPIHGDIRYVGKSDDPQKRLWYHISTAKRRNHKDNWIRFLKSRGLKPGLVILEKVDADAWQEREMYWIALFRSVGDRLLNVSDGGEGRSKGSTTSAKTKEKMSAAHIGRKFSDEHKKKLGAVQKGRRLPTAHRNNISKSRQGIKQSKSSSRFVGVSWNKRKGKWKVSIRVGRKNTHLGYFHKESDAAYAYNKAALLHFGIDAKINKI